LILFSQQIENIVKIYNKFNLNSSYPTKEELQRFKMFLNPKKFEGKTIQDFKIIVLFAVFKYNPRNKIDLLNILNSFDDNDIKEAMRFKRILESIEWQKNEDLSKIKNPMLQYRKSEITFLGLYYYYKKHPEEARGRILKRELEKIKVLLKMLGVEV
jgi:hypothetical protein